MKFIHCADFHLDSSLHTNLDPDKALRRRGELMGCFERIVAYAKDNDVRAILIAGDLTDSIHRNPSTVRTLLYTMRQAPDIDFLYIRGNHDQRPIFDGNDLPENLKLFDDTWTSYRYGDVVITGTELTGEQSHHCYERLRLDTNDRNIVMLHGQTSTLPGPDQVALPLLRGKHVDYLALGHLHSYQTGSLDHRGIWCYCGCPEGRGFDECGEKGFVLISAGQDSLTHEFVPFACRTVHSVETDITGLSDAADILSSVRSTICHIPCEDLIKVTLTGTYTPDTQKDLQFVQSMLSSDRFCLKLADETTLLTPSSSIKEVSLQAEFIRSVSLDDTLSAEEAQTILQLGLAALHGEELNL